ncbi:carbohydrate ABC transporter permease [Desulfocurvus sp. DL9XJH121]
MRPHLLYKRLLPYFLSGPAMALMILFLIGPILAVLALSFTDWQLGEEVMNYVGLANYRALFSDPLFLHSLRNTALYILMTVPTTLFLGLILAMLIMDSGPMRGLYETAFFLPFMGTAVAMLIVWEFVLDPNMGVWGSIAHWFGLDPANFLRDESTALPALAAISVWQNLGFAMVLFMAGLSGIPKEMYEAGELDGADDAVSRFSLVTWPLVSHVTFFVFILLAVRSFQVFESVAVLTRGGPNDATEVLTYTMYKEGFDFFRTNMASAITVVFLAGIGTLVLAQSMWLERRVHYK